MRFSAVDAFVEMTQVNKKTPVTSMCNWRLSGEGGIRTLGDVSATPVFETGPFGRSGTSPKLISSKDLRPFFHRSLCSDLLP